MVLAFEGASGIDPDELDAIVDQQKLERQLFTDPVVVTELLERYYREQGYLSAEIDEPRYEYQGRRARVVLAVREGPAVHVRRVTTSGNTVLTPTALLPQLPVVAGDPFLPCAAEHALDKHPRRCTGSTATTTCARTTPWSSIAAGGQVDVAFTIVEGPQSVIARHRRSRATRSISEQLVREQVELDAGAAARPVARWRKSRRNLYDTGAFSIVDITAPSATRRAQDADVAAPATADRRSATAGAQELDAIHRTARSRSAQRRRPRGAAVPAALRRVVRHRARPRRHPRHLQPQLARQGARDRPAVALRPAAARRPPLHQPAVAALLAAQTTGSLYFREELNPPTELTDPFDVSRKGASIQQEIKLRDCVRLELRLSLRDARDARAVAGRGVIGETLTVSPLTSTLTRETRDEVLDASRGAFLSQAFAYSPGWLGSDLPYLKYFGQYFHYFPLQPPQRKPFTNEILRPRLVFATGVRVGLAKGIGGEVPTSERFFAGGSTTLRGFAQNAVGPIGARTACPTGGNALLVLNNELRVPLVSIVDGVRVRRHRQRVPADQRLLVRRPPRVGRRRPARAHAVVPAPRRLRHGARSASGRAAQPLLLQHRPGVLM